MLEGLRSCIYEVGDLDAAKAWYTEVLGTAPYFDEPFYVGFDVGGYELGLLPTDRTEPPSGGQSYWGVVDIAAAWDDLISRGAQPVSAPQDVGEGITLAVLVDPAGNRLGIIENPHFVAR
jgi:predicted enzyme related to lactoylglutathione lyase